MHAEKCPVCDGEGSLAGVLPDEKRTCHGCEGRGWVTVGREFLQTPYIPMPYPVYPDSAWYPRWPEITWTCNHTTADGVARLENIN